MFKAVPDGAVANMEITCKWGTPSRGLCSDMFPVNHGDSFSEELLDNHVTLVHSGHVTLVHSGHVTLVRGGHMTLVLHDHVTLVHEGHVILV